MDQRDREIRDAVDSAPTNWVVLAGGIIGLVLIIGLFAFNSTTGDEQANVPVATKAGKAPAGGTTGQAPAVR
jgi:hypothetical protein